MGLDQYLYQLRKPTRETIEFMSNRLLYSLPEKIHYFPTDDEDAMTHIKSIANFSVKATILTTSFDYELLYKDNGLPDDARCTRISVRPEGEYYTYECENKKSRRIFVDEWDLRHRYEIVVPKEYVLISLDEVHYWREARTIQAYMRNVHDTKNCDYAILDGSDLRMFAKLDENFDISEYGDGVFCYHEWY